MRLLYKTISYCITHIIVAIAIAYIFTGNLAISIGIGLIEPIVQSFIFAIHDFIWEKDKISISICAHK